MSSIPTFSYMVLFLYVPLPRWTDGLEKIMDEELFKSKEPSGTEQDAPLAYRMRPETLDDFVGQEHILGEGKLLRRLISADRLTSLIFFGPPGCGKTALASVIARTTKKPFVCLNAITASVADVRKIIEEAKWRRKRDNSRTVLFIDEISHFNKLQQDALMPEIENGTMILIGATTHNPFFSVNRAIISRSIVLEFKPLAPEHIAVLLKRAVSDVRSGFKDMNVRVSDEAINHIVKTADGDARRALSALEIAVLTAEPSAGGIIIGLKEAQEATGRRYVPYDREDEHYNTISAFIKSIRGSDPDAALYWLARMLAGGEDPAFIARRLLIAASEDIGNADPMGVVVAASVLQAVEFVGMPEARISLAQATIYLATCPKSNASYLAIEKAAGEVEKELTQPVPDHLKSTGYTGAEVLGHGKGYLYPHDFKGAFVDQRYMERKMKFYQPKDSGYERKIRYFLQQIERMRNQNGKRNETTSQKSDEGKKREHAG